MVSCMSFQTYPSPRATRLKRPVTENYPVYPLSSGSRTPSRVVAHYLGHLRGIPAHCIGVFDVGMISEQRRTSTKLGYSFHDTAWPRTRARLNRTQSRSERESSGWRQDSQTHSTVALIVTWCTTASSDIVRLHLGLVPPSQSSMDRDEAATYGSSSDLHSRGRGRFRPLNSSHRARGSFVTFRRAHDGPPHDGASNKNIPAST